MNCEKCWNSYQGYNTGEVNQGGYLDCVHCGVADERVALNEAMKDVNLIRQDEHFHAYQLGKAAAMREAAASAVAVAWIVFAEYQGLMFPQYPARSTKAEAKRESKLYGQTKTEVRALYAAPVEPAADLLPMLRKMWGHAIELGDTDYFDDEQFEKEQYRQDCIEAAKLIQACKKSLT